MHYHDAQQFAKLPHRITQFGSRREAVFLDDESHAVYLNWLGGSAAKVIANIEKPAGRELRFKLRGWPKKVEE